MNKPLVSLLIPTYNSAKYLAKSLDSALAQNYSNLEIIVHDDASTDTTPALLNKYRHLPQVRLIRTHTNHGMIGGWNYLAQKAKGKYLKFLASDDLLSFNCVKELVEAAEKHPQTALVTCKRVIINESGSKIKTLGFVTQNKVVKGRLYAHQVLTTIRENKIGEPTSVLYPTKLLLKAGGYDPHFSQFADFEYWLRLLEFGDLVYLNKSLCSFRTHASSNTTKAIYDGRFIDEIFTLIHKYYSSPHYRHVFSLTEEDHRFVTKIKTLDVLKNIKDLFLAGRLVQARKYLFCLTKHVKLDYMTRITLVHILK